MHKLIDYICEELEELEHKADKGKLSMAEMQYVDTLAHAKKNLLKSEEMKDGASYSRMPIYRSDRDYSMARKRDARGRYSSKSDMIIEELRDLMADAPDEHTRVEFQKFIQKMEQM